MKRGRIDASGIRDRETFHDVFAEAFGFPGFYGRNMDAWIDCMSYLDEPDSGMTKVTCEQGDYVVLELDGVEGFRKCCRELYDALIECCAFVDWRRLDTDDNPLLMLSFYA